VSPVTPLSPEVAKAVVAALQQTADTDAARSDSVGPPPAAVAQAAAPIQHVPQPAAQPTAQPQSDQPVANRAPLRRRSDEVAAPRRAADTRKHVETNAADAIGLAQRVSETPREAAALHEAANVSAKGDTVVQQTLTIARDGAWLDRLARDIASAGNGSDLHFKLDPQNLGALSVAISQSADGASIRLTTDNDRTRDILLDAQPKLIAEARAQGLKVSDTHVDLNQNQNQSQNQPQQQHNPNPDLSRWAQGNGGQSGAQSGQNRQSSPGHQPFVSNPERKAKGETESPGDSDALYA
jgi:flagellar hook-length control protein FliK